MPNPQLHVEELTFRHNHNDQRGIYGSLRDSNVVNAPEHHTFSVPPIMPQARSLLETMRSEPPVHRALAPPSPPKGMAGLMFDSSSERLVPRTAAFDQPVARRVSPRRPDTSPRGVLSSGVSHSFSPEVHAATAETRSRPTAAERFLQGDKYVKASVLPSVLPPPIHANPRSGATVRAPTLPLTQAAPQTGLFASTEQRFDANTRGLNIGRVAHEDKLRRQVVQEVKTAVRREAERRVVESRLADGERNIRIDEARILSKARQRSAYNERMSSYKFTK
jgi:hypothetical protein